MAGSLKFLGLIVCVVMVAGDNHSDNTLETLADMQREIYLKTAEFFNSSVTMELGKMMGKLRAIESRLEEVEGRLEDYDFKIPPAELGASCDAERALVRLNSSLATWYQNLVHRMEAIEQVMQFISVSDTSAARTGSDNEVPKVPPEVPEPEPEPTTTTRKPKTTRRYTTRRPTTTTLPPTTTTIPTTTPTTTMPTTTPMPTPATCAELAQRGETRSGTYLIDPTRSGNAFYVECELPKGVTSIGHSVANREVQNNNNEDPGSFSLDPMYDASIDQMKALTAASQNCSQFIKYRCRGAVLLAQDKKTTLRYGYWVSADGEQIVSWGGAPINSEQCACALSPSGCLGGKMCNCDSNPKEFAIDEGLLTDKPYLPVTNVHLGDTGNKKEIGFVTLGPLRCQ